MPTFPLTTSTRVLADAYNIVFETVNEVIGVGEDGYGLQDFFTIPVTTGTVVRARHWQNMRVDLVETTYRHITSVTNVLTEVITTGTTYITTATPNEAKVLADEILSRRFECHENNYYRDPVTGISTNTTGGVSTRTVEWGVTENYIEHKVKVRWPTRLLARYFFNCGGYFNWTPYHSNNGLNDIDAEWASFIYAIQVEQGSNTTNTGALVYDRTKFVNQTAGTTATIYPTGSTRSFPDPTYEQGTLSINVEAFKSLNEETVEFTITFQNSDVGTLIVAPTVGYWNFIV